MTPPEGVKTAELTAEGVKHQFDAQSGLAKLDASKLKFTRTTTPMSVCIRNLLFQFSSGVLDPMSSLIFKVEFN